MSPTCQMSVLFLETSATNEEQGVHLTHNASQRFESRFCSVRIEDSSSIMLKGMAGSVLGIWVAHGEGKISVDIFLINNFHYI